MFEKLLLVVFLQLLDHVSLLSPVLVFFLLSWYKYVNECTYTSNSMHLNLIYNQLDLKYTGNLVWRIVILVTASFFPGILSPLVCFFRRLIRHVVYLDLSINLKDEIKRRG